MKYEGNHYLPSYRTIIDHLAELSPDSSGRAIAAAALRLLPQGETLGDRETITHIIEADTRAWATRLAFESLRGWHWPYWMNVQTNPLSPAAITALHQPLMFNVVARDLRPIVQLDSGKFAGTLDARGMFTPPTGSFSIEVWLRVGDQVVYPSCIFDRKNLHFEGATESPKFQLEAAGYCLTLTTVARELDGFEFVSVAGNLSRAGNHGGSAEAETGTATAVYVAIRPYTPDGVVPVHDLVYNSKGFWMSDSRIIALFPRRPDISWASDAVHGDAGLFLMAPPERTAVRCAAGMASAISAFHVSPEAPTNSSFECILPLMPVYPREVPFHLFAASDGGSKRKSTINAPAESAPKHGLREAATPLLSASLEQLIAATDVASPIMQQILLQRNHWIVPAVETLHRYDGGHFAGRLLSYCALGLGRNGYLPHSHGKLAFPGQFLSALACHYRQGGNQPDESIVRFTQVKAIARWISRKRREVSYAPKKPAGLFPPGLTRDGVGREYLLADNIWGIEGLAQTSWLARQFGEHSVADALQEEAVNFGSQLSAAIHRELEYGIMQKVPGRLHRAFDPASAAELLDLAITPEARSLIGGTGSWLSAVVGEITQPLVSGAAGTAENSALMRMDERGVSPARHLMLALLCQELEICDGPDLLTIDGFATASGVWTEFIDPETGGGRGALHFDPEAAALYLLLTRKLKDLANNRGS